MVMTEERLLTVREIADTLRVHENTVLAWLKRGTLRGFRVGGTKSGWRIRESELRRFIAEREGRREEEQSDDGE